jgi:hypothetical protein
MAEETYVPYTERLYPTVPYYDHLIAYFRRLEGTYEGPDGVGTTETDRINLIIRELQCLRNGENPEGIRAVEPIDMEPVRVNKLRRPLGEPTFLYPSTDSEAQEQLKSLTEPSSNPLEEKVTQVNSVFKNITVYPHTTLVEMLNCLSQELAFDLLFQPNETVAVGELIPLGDLKPNADHCIDLFKDLYHRKAYHRGYDERLTDFRAIRKIYIQLSRRMRMYVIEKLTAFADECIAARANYHTDGGAFSVF